MKSGRREDAKRLLVHYFRLVSEKPLDGDNVAEIESIVDLICDAADEEASAVNSVINQTI